MKIAINKTAYQKKDRLEFIQVLLTKAVCTTERANSFSRKTDNSRVLSNTYNYSEN